MSQPLDRTHQCKAIGEVDTAAGEFWVDSPFQMPKLGHNLSAYENNRVYINVHGRKFLDASFISAADIDSDSRSAMAGDFDGDGMVDVLVGSVGGGPLRLFRNRIVSGNHRVQIELQGRRSNRPAIGARVQLRCSAQTITRDLFPANGFMGQSPTELLVGVGSATVIDELIVRWPGGQSQRFTNLPVDKRLQIAEGESDVRTSDLSQPVREPAL